MESGKSVRISSKFLVADQQIQSNVLTCKKCNKRVYEMEKFMADKDCYHKTCFKCAHCNRILSLNNYTASGPDKIPYCKPHFMELFKKKGNYEEGFGGERLTSGRYDQFQGFKSPSQASS